jgi:hypothetical protein
MGVRQLLRNGVAASALAHASVLALVFWSSEVHPLGRVTAEPIMVDIVAPHEVPAPAPEVPKPPQSLPPDAAAPAKPADPAPAPPASNPLRPAQAPSPLPAPQPAASAKPQPQAQPATAAKPQAQPAVAATPQPQPAAAVNPPPPAQPPSPSQARSVTEDIDFTMTYHALLGMLDHTPPGAPDGSREKRGDAGDATDSAAIDLQSSIVAEFRRHLRTCSKLPPSIAVSDKVIIKLRTFLTTDGRLAGEPMVVEGTGNLKGLDLRQSAVEALRACQPYSMLPKARYREWKVIDLTFTPEDFSS